MSDRFPIAVLVSGTGTNLQALLDTVHGREAQVVAVAEGADAACEALIALAKQRGGSDNVTCVVVRLVEA